MEYIVYYLLSVPIVAMAFLLLLSYLDKDERVFFAGLFSLVGAAVWPLTIIFIIYSRFDDWKNVKNSKGPGDVGK